MWISVGRQTITLSMIYEPRGEETGGDAKVTRNDRLATCKHIFARSSFDEYREPAFRFYGPLEWRLLSRFGRTNNFFVLSLSCFLFPCLDSSRGITRVPKNKPALSSLYNAGIRCLSFSTSTISLLSNGDPSLSVPFLTFDLSLCPATVNRLARPLSSTSGTFTFFCCFYRSRGPAFGEPARASESDSRG